MKFTGVVQKKRIAIGSKSERDALVMHQKGADFILRRFGSNAMEIDEELLELEGETVTLEGAFHNTLFIFKEIE